MYRLSVMMTQNFVHIDMTERLLDCHQFQGCYITLEADTGEPVADLHIPKGSFFTVIAPAMWNFLRHRVC